MIKSVTMVLVSKDMDESVKRSFVTLCKLDREPFSEDEVEVCHANSSTLLNSTLEDSDEEISTQKDKHGRLGPENLNETVAYDFLDTD